MASARCAYRGCLRALVLRGGVQRAAVPTFGSGTMVPLRSRKTEPRQASRGAAGEGHDVAQGSNSLPRPDLRKLAQLAKVSLTDEQIEDFQPKVDRVVDWYACDSVYPNYARAAWVLQLADTNNVLTVLYVSCPPPPFSSPGLPSSRRLTWTRRRSRTSRWLTRPAGPRSGRTRPGSTKRGESNDKSPPSPRPGLPVLLTVASPQRAILSPSLRFLRRALPLSQGGSAESDSV